MKRFIIYHHPCPDGFCSRWVATLKYGKDAVYIGADYGDPLPAIPDGSEVIMIDVSWPRPILEELKERVSSLTILDHHATARKELEGFPGAVFDEELSGCGLAWAFFFDGEPPPKLVRYVQDRDLWRFEYGDVTRDVHAYLSALPWDVQAWDHASHFLHTDAERVLEAGRLIRNFSRKVQEDVAATAHAVEIGEFLLLAVNLQAKTFVSDTLHILLDQNPKQYVVASYRQNADGTWSWSLRSREGTDCSIIAKTFGGGGHPQASGFTTHTAPRWRSRTMPGG